MENSIVKKKKKNIFKLAENAPNIALKYSQVSIMSQAICFEESCLCLSWGGSVFGVKKNIAVIPHYFQEQLDPLKIFKHYQQLKADMGIFWALCSLN